MQKVAVLAEMEESIFKKELNAELLDAKVKIEPRDELEFQAGLAILETMDESICNKKPKMEPLNIQPEIEFKKEVEDAELQAGLNVLEKMDDSVFGKDTKVEILDVKPKNESKKELESSINNIEGEMMATSTPNEQLQNLDSPNFGEPSPQTSEEVNKSTVKRTEWEYSCGCRCM